MFSNVSYILFINPGAYSDRSGHGFESKQIDLPIPGVTLGIVGSKK